MEEQSKPPIIYGMEYQGRSLANRGSLVNDFERIQFLCGSQTLQHENKIHMIEYNDTEDVIEKVSFPHPEGEVWHIRCSVVQSTMFTTSYSKVSDGTLIYGVGLWSFEEPDGPSSEAMLPSNIRKITPIDHSYTGNVIKTLWNPQNGTEQLVTFDSSKMKLWRLDDGTLECSSEIEQSHRGLTSFTCGSWNPHHNANQIALSCGEGIRAVDIRSKESVFSIDHAHDQQVRDIDFNPNKMYHFASCGDDCQVHFWDSRKTVEPLLTRRDHSHWVWSVRFNPTYDQLVLTGSSDSQVFLCRVASVASEPMRDLDDDSSRNRKEVLDCVVKEYEEHEDSVYCVEWSGVDPWIFASLSYDGRLVLNHVPNKEKFNIFTI